MSINYKKILDNNMINVLKDILYEIKKKGLSNSNHLYISFRTDHKDVEIPIWLLEKYPKEMTIIIQYEYYNLNISSNFFQITLLFNQISADLKIGFNSIISFADPSANFGLRLKITDETKIKNKDNIINFSNFKKTNLNKNDL